MSDMVIISVDYDEFDQDSYRAFVLDFRDGNTLRYATGDPVKDFADAFDWIATLEGIEHILFNSSADHFVSDGDKYYYDENSWLQRRETAQ